ncbi:Cu,Zn superoxide dismutase-like protein [Ramicandelaber brevisporus]|nr:Cu,Zn superoxide dismutase-like protein [Ramicandelaber brevisporus]
MKPTFTIAAVAVAATALLGALAPGVDATTASATFSGPAMYGAVQFNSLPSGSGVSIAINIVAGPQVGKSYAWHIHNKPVPADGNCVATEGHFDPYNVKANSKPEYKCNPADKLNTCELGDLSGKYGPIKATCGSTFSTCVVDENINMDMLAGKSVVIHDGDARIVCANIAA